MGNTGQDAVGHEIQVTEGGGGGEFAWGGGSACRVGACIPKKWSHFHGDQSDGGQSHLMQNQLGTLFFA